MRAPVRAMLWYSRWPTRLKPWQNCRTSSLLELERVAGIEPARSAWEADRLPLHHTRLCLLVSMAAARSAIARSSGLASLPRCLGEGSSERAVEIAPSSICRRDGLRVLRGKLHREHLAADARGQGWREFQRDTALDRGDRRIHEVLLRLLIAGDRDIGRLRRADQRAVAFEAEAQRDEGALRIRPARSSRLGSPRPPRPWC